MTKMIDIVRFLNCDDWNVDYTSSSTILFYLASAIECFRICATLSGYPTIYTNSNFIDNILTNAYSDDYVSGVINPLLQTTSDSTYILTFVLRGSCRSIR